jgi:alkanesulfonate monooxygenase SsuD/methylene tetrahydromethanopterin reductase-like flavin-dependent oxidoreductase (luciferase family)
MRTPTFGIFDHIEGIPGTSVAQVLKDRLDFVRMADEAGFVGYHLAEHHGSDLCLAPNQELFVAAASQITERIRMGPMVKLLPMHHPVSLIEDMCVADNLTGGRLDFGVGRGPAPVEHFWHNSEWPTSAERFEDVLGIICRALRTGEISSEGSKFYNFRTMPMATPPVQEHIPFWYPGNPVNAGRFGLNLMWPGPVPKEVHDLYVESWHTHAGDPVRLDGPDAEPRVGCTMLLAIADDESEALDVATRGMNGLVRRTHSVHRWDVEILGQEGADEAIKPLHKILGSIDIAIQYGAGTPEQIRDRFAELLGTGLTDYIVLQIPTGDMTFDEAKRTLDMFCTKVKPDLEQLA